MVGLTRLELVTPALSTQCSNQLSYRPLTEAEYMKDYLSRQAKNVYFLIFFVNTFITE